MSIESINFKVHSKIQPEGLEQFLPVFYDWIRLELLEGLFIDVADYSHVPGGPGVLLIGDRIHLAVEFGAENRFGISFQDKRQGDKANPDRIEAAIRKILRASLALEQDDRISPALIFEPEIIRVRVSGTVSSTEVLRSRLEKIFRKIYGEIPVNISPTSQEGTPLLTLEVKAESTKSIRELLELPSDNLELVS